MSHTSMITSEISHRFGRVQLMKSFIGFFCTVFFLLRLSIAFFNAQNTGSVFNIVPALWPTGLRLARVRLCWLQWWTIPFCSDLWKSGGDSVVLLEPLKSLREDWKEGFCGVDTVIRRNSLKDFAAVGETRGVFVLCLVLTAWSLLCHHYLSPATFLIISSLSIPPLFISSSLLLS